MNKKILVADDDPAIAESTCMILKEFGYSVESTFDGKTIDKTRQIFPDLLILDIWMSGEDGRIICKDLKKNPRTKKIPVILISASQDIKKSAYEAGADDFIEKPFEMQELLKKVKKWTH